MTRKDTILIAVLVNAAILVVLFVTAVKPGKSGSIVATPAPAEHPIAEIQPLALPLAEKGGIKVAQGDEIDQVLKEFSQKAQQQLHTSDQNTTAAAPIDFAKELEAITRAASTPVSIEQNNTEVSEVASVTVKKGDVLEKIARAHQVSVDELMKFNHLSSTMLKIGQVLKVPGKGQKTGGATSFSSEGGEQYYTVKQGDNPWTIAVKNHLKLDELLKLNNLNSEKAKKLRPGDKLRIK